MKQMGYNPKKMAKLYVPSYKKGFNAESQKPNEIKDYSELLKLAKVTDKNAPFLDDAGFSTIELIAKATIKELVKVEKIGEATAESIKAEAIELTGVENVSDGKGDGLVNTETEPNAENDGSTEAVSDEEVGSEGTIDGEAESQI
jgi:hypothetical protein